MKAYLGDSQLKKRLMAQVRAHKKAGDLVKADKLSKGPYQWEDNRGGPVGCLTHDPNGGHDKYGSEWGIPVHLAYLEDAIFEGLPDTEAQMWPEKFLNAIEPGMELSLTWFNWASETLHQDILPLDSVKENPQLLTHLERVAQLYDRVREGEDIRMRDWDAIACAADEAKEWKNQKLYVVSAIARANIYIPVTWGAVMLLAREATGRPWQRFASRLLERIQEAPQVEEPSIGSSSRRKVKL